MALVAFVALVIAARDLLLKREHALFRAKQCRTLELREETESLPQIQERGRESIQLWRPWIFRWVEQAEARGSIDAACCQCLLAATDRLIEETRDRPLGQDDAATYYAAVTRCIGAGRMQGGPTRHRPIGHNLEPDSFVNFAFWVEDLAGELVFNAKRVEHFARLGQKYERAASRPWLPVEPEPAEPNWSFARP